jgi:hypothetical protein
MKKGSTILIVKPEGTSSIGRYGHRREISTRKDLMEIDLRMWTAFIQFKIGTGCGRSLANAGTNFRIP